MKHGIIAKLHKNFNEYTQKTERGLEFWFARDLQELLGYDKWDKFENVIKKAVMACDSTGVDSNNQFLQTGKMVEIGSNAYREKKDYFLTRYACYLISMNGDSSKPEIGIAQGYFAVQTRKQELQDKLTADERRILLRNRVKNANLSLASTAKKVGVQKYGVFQNAGYLGLYEMGLSDIKKYKGLDQKENILDRMGRTELAANEFRITQTEDKIIREDIRGEKQAIDTHLNVGQEIRSTIKKLGGIMPEDLSPETSIKKLMNKKTKEIKSNIKQLPE